MGAAAITQPNRRARVAHMRARVVFVTLVAGYFASFIVTYDTLLEPYQGFWGFGRANWNWEYQLLSWVLVLAPALWLPLELRRPSQLLFMFQYLVMFVPATAVLYNSALPHLPAGDVTELLLAMFVGLSLVQAIYLVPLVRLPVVRVSPRVFWWTFYVLLVALAIGLVVVLRRNLRFEGLNVIYTLRFDATDLLTASGLEYVFYFVAWFAGVFLPVAFAHAVWRRSVTLLALVTAGYVFLFGVTGTKTALLAIVILAALRPVVRLRGARFSHGFAAGLAVVLLVPFVFGPFGPTGDLLQKAYVLFVHTRIFGVPQLLIGQYLAFFQQHPLTWWSHVHLIDAFVNYPYAIDIPYTLGYYYYEFAVGLNGGMWTQDGVGAAGLGGVLLVSLAGALVLWAFDSLSARISPPFVALASTVIAITFMNAPLSTTLLTGGLGLLALLMYLMPADALVGGSDDGG